MVGCSAAGDTAGRAIVRADEPTAASSGWAAGVADAASTYDVLMRVPIQKFASCPAPLDGVRKARSGGRASVSESGPADGSTCLECPPGRVV
jgi:hypothetical protein